MHILYVHQYFITPKTEGGTRSYEFSKSFVKAGHKVTMVTSGIQNPEFPVKKGEAYTEYDHEGIRVLAIRAGYNDARKGTNLDGYRRMLKFHRFANYAAKIGKTVTDADVIYATHTPLTVGLTGIKLAKALNLPFVFEVRDLWPDALINIGALTNPLGIWHLRRMERKIYHAADHIIALSPGMKEGVCKQNIPEDKVTVIPNSSDLNIFKPSNDGTAHRERMGLGDRTAAIYFGAMGLANGLDYALDAAAELQRRKRDDIVIILHGEGGEKESLKKRAKAEGLDNVIFSDSVPNKTDVADIVAGCDICMTIYRATKEVTWSPNKMFDAMAAGRPVLINVGEWLGQTVEENDCGKAVAAKDPNELADALIDLADDPAKRARQGANSRKTAEQYFDRKILAEKVQQVLSNAIAGHKK
jgi:glycosyltransferase involved in cell wall biosynthesis